MNLGNFVILNINGADYRCIVKIISTNEAADLLQKADLNEKSGTLSHISHIEMGKPVITVHYKV